MPKNKGKGGRKGRKRKGGIGLKRDLAIKEENQEYGQVLRMLGNGMAELQCFDDQKRIGVICGKMRNRVWIGAGDVVLSCLRGVGDRKCDITVKYTPDEIKVLKANGEIPYSLETNAEKEENDMEIKFEQDEDEDEEAEEIDYDDDMPPNSSDEEAWEAHAQKLAAQKQQKKKNKFEEIAEKEDEPAEKKGAPLKKEDPNAPKKYDVASDSSSDDDDDLADV